MTAWPALSFQEEDDSPKPQRPLDVVWLAVLGTAMGGGATLSQIRNAFAGEGWRPEPCMLAAAIDEMTRGGHLRPRCHVEGIAFDITARGRETLCLLLCVPSGSPETPLGRLEDGLKRAVTGAGPVLVPIG